VREKKGRKELNISAAAASANIAAGTAQETAESTAQKLSGD
jgi:hypothetical protein